MIILKQQTENLTASGYHNVLHWMDTSQFDLKCLKSDKNQKKVTFIPENSLFLHQNLSTMKMSGNYASQLVNNDKFLQKYILDGQIYYK